MTASQSASAMSRNSAARKMPALLTRTSMRPKAATVPASAAATSPLRATLHAKPSARAPALAELGGERLRRGGVDVPERDRSAAGREQTRAGGADAVRGAGDDRDLAGEIEADLVHAARRSSQMAMPWAFSSRSSSSSSRMRASLKRHAVRAQACQVDRLEAAHQRGMAIRPARRRPREGHHLLELTEQERGESRHVADAAIVGDIDPVRIERDHAFDRAAQGLGLELHRRRRRHDPGAGGGVEIAVRQAERVAGEEAAARRCPRCSGGASRGRACAGNCSGRPASSIVIPSCVVDHPLCGDRHELAVRALDLLGAVDRGRAPDQMGGPGEVARAARMDDEPRARQVLHQQADAARVVEVDVGRDDVVDGVDVESCGGEGGEQARHRMVRAGIDERRAAALDDQVGGVEERPMKARVDDVDAVREPFDEVRREAGARRGSFTRSDAASAADARRPILESRVASVEKGRSPESAVRLSCDPAGSRDDEALRSCLAPDRCLVARHGDDRLHASCDRLRRCPPARRSRTRARRFGAGDEYPLPNGGTRLSFPRGKDTYMLDFDASGQLVESHQALNLQTLRHHPAGDAAGRGADPSRPAGVGLSGRLAEAAGLNYRFGGLEGDCMSSRSRSATPRATSPRPGPAPIRIARAAIRGKSSCASLRPQAASPARAARVRSHPVAAAARGFRPRAVAAARTAGCRRACSSRPRSRCRCAG